MQEAESAGHIRIDKWLWAARVFKTRSLAAEAVEGGKVHLNGARTKPGKTIRIGDEIRIRRGPYEWVVIVRDLSLRRGPARVAQLLYEETEESKLNRERLAQELRVQARGPEPRGRPTKKARRELERFKRGDW